MADETIEIGVKLNWAPGDVRVLVKIPAGFERDREKFPTQADFEKAVNRAVEGWILGRGRDLPEVLCLHGLEVEVFGLPRPGGCGLVWEQRCGEVTERFEAPDVATLKAMIEAAHPVYTISAAPPAGVTSLTGEQLRAEFEKYASGLDRMWLEQPRPGGGLSDKQIKAAVDEYLDKLCRHLNIPKRIFTGEAGAPAAGAEPAPLEITVNPAHDNRTPFEKAWTESIERQTLDADTRPEAETPPKEAVPEMPAAPPGMVSVPCDATGVPLSAEAIYETRAVRRRILRTAVAQRRFDHRGLAVAEYVCAWETDGRPHRKLVWVRDPIMKLTVGGFTNVLVHADVAPGDSPTWADAAALRRQVQEAFEKQYADLLAPAAPVRPGGGFLFLDEPG
jgi:hypothetical protein